MTEKIRCMRVCVCRGGASNRKKNDSDPRAAVDGEALRSAAGMYENVYAKGVCVCAGVLLRKCEKRGRVTNA